MIFIKIQRLAKGFQHSKSKKNVLGLSSISVIRLQYEIGSESAYKNVDPKQCFSLSVS